MNQKVEKAINDQIRWELYSAYLYLSMSSWYESIGLRGFANWERIQAQEERDHAMRFFDYVISRGGRVILQAIDAPEAEWKSPLKAFRHSYAHEQKVTTLINSLVDLSLEEKDHATYNMLQWFVDEQIEEEANASDIVNKLELIDKESGSGMLFMLDNELAMRVYKPPVTEKT